MKYANGDVYEGEWAKDNRNGRGIMQSVLGDFYDGERRLRWIK